MASISNSLQLLHQSNDQMSISIFTIIKLNAFYLFHISLNNQTKSSWDIFLLSIFDGIQCLSFSFALIFNETWEIKSFTMIPLYINRFFKIFLFTPYLMASSYSLYLVSFLLSVLLSFFLLGFTIYLMCLLYNNYTLAKWQTALFDFFARYFNGIILIPILLAILPILHCQKFISEYSTIFQFETNFDYCSSAEGVVFQVLSVITLIIVVFFSYIFSSFYFDMRLTHSNHMSRLSPRFDLWMLTVKIIVCLSFQFVTYDLNNSNSDIKIIFSGVLIFASILMLVVVKINILFYSVLTRKIYETMIMILVITNGILFIDQVMIFFSMNDFDGIIELWCAAITFNILYYVFSNENYATALPAKTDDISASYQAIKSTLTFLRLINKRSKHMQYEVILNGYIFNHIPLCNQVDCPLKQYKQSNCHLEINPLGKSFLIQHLNELFLNYLIIFPKDLHLRIIYSLYCFEVLVKINISRMHMMTALNENPSLQQQFCLYRLNKIIDDQYLNIDDDAVNLTIASTIVYDQYFKQFQETIKSIGVKYLEFWTSFVQEETNMTKIKMTGNNILFNILKVFKLWDQMQEINSNDYDCLRLYGQFQLDILNDKTKGESCLMESKELLITTGRQIKLFKNDINHLCYDGAPVLIANQVENEELVISQVTNSFIRLFEYQKVELIGKDISFLLPYDLREEHMRVVKEFLKENHYKKFIEKRKIKGVALNKNGYIFPIKFTMALLPNLTKEFNMAILVKKDKKIVNYTCQMIINNQLEILGISSQSIKLLNITEKGLWNIRNNKKIKGNDRINLRYLIKEMNILSNAFKSSDYKQSEMASVYDSNIKDEKSLLTIANVDMKIETSRPQSTIQPSPMTNHLQLLYSPLHQHQQKQELQYKQKPFQGKLKSQWKDNKYLKHFEDEKNGTMVHLLDFQQVYHVTFENTNIKEDYLSTLKDKNLLNCKNAEHKRLSYSNSNMNLNTSIGGINPCTSQQQQQQHIIAYMTISDIIFKYNPIGLYVIKLEHVFNDTNIEKSKNLMPFTKGSNFNLRNNLSKTTSISEYKFKKNKIFKFNVDNGFYTIETKTKGKTSSIVITNNIRNNYYNNTQITNIEVVDCYCSKSKSSLDNSNKNNDNSSRNSSSRSSNSSKSKKNFKQRRKPKLNLHSDTNEKDDYSPISRCSKDKRHSLPRAIFRNEEDVYNTLYFQDYSIDVAYYDLDSNTLTCSIFSKPIPKEGKRLTELTHFFENDTLKIDDDISNIQNSEENDFKKAKYDINKNDILKGHMTKTSRVIFKQITLSSFIVFVHVTLSILAIVYYHSYLFKTKNNILCMKSIASLLNYTMTSNSYFLDSLLFRHYPSISINSFIGLKTNLSDKLRQNAEEINNILAITDKFLLETFNEVNALHSNNSLTINMTIIIRVNDHQKPLTQIYQLPYNEATHYLMAAIFSLSTNININSSYFDLDAFFLCFNTINEYYLKSMQYIQSIKDLIINQREPNDTQLAIIYTSLGSNIVLLFILYLWTSIAMKQMNDIVLEFLSIKQVEALFIVKKIEKFIKNIRINDLEAAEEEENDDDLEMMDKKRNNKYIADRMRRMQFEEIILIILIIGILLFFILYFIIQYTIVDSYDNSSNQLVELYYSLTQFATNIHLIIIGVKIRFFANEEITMLNQPIDPMISKQFDIYLILKEKLVYDIQYRGAYSKNFTEVYNSKIALENLQFNNNWVKDFIDSLPNLTFDYTLAYYYNTLLSSYYYSLTVSKEEALGDMRLFHSNTIKDYILNPYLTTVSVSAIEDTVRQTNFIWSFVQIWFYVWLIFLVVIFLGFWLPLLRRLEKEIKRTKFLILLVPTNILMNKKAFLEILKNENMISVRK